MQFRRTIPLHTDVHSVGGSFIATAIELWDDETVLTVVGPSVDRGMENGFFDWTLTDSTGVSMKAGGFGGSGGRDRVRYTLRFGRVEERPLVLRTDTTEVPLLDA